MGDPGGGGNRRGLAIALAILTVGLGLGLAAVPVAGWIVVFAQAGLFAYLVLAMRRSLDWRSRSLDAALFVAIALVGVRSVALIPDAMIGSFVTEPNGVQNALVRIGVLFLQPQPSGELYVEAGPVALARWAFALCGASFVVLALQLRRLHIETNRGFDQYRGALLIAGAIWAVNGFLPGGLVTSLVPLTAFIAEAASDYRLGTVFGPAGAAVADAGAPASGLSVEARAGIVALYSLAALGFAGLMSFVSVFCADSGGPGCFNDLMWPVGVFLLTVIGTDVAVFSQKTRPAWILFGISLVVALGAFWHIAHS